jgi:hypothetical protein
MRKLIHASVLVLALAIPAFAGDIPNMVTSTPPPANITQQGDIPNGVTSLEPTTSEVLIELFFALVP